MTDYIAYYRVSTEKQARRRKEPPGEQSEADPANGLAALEAKTPQENATAREENATARPEEQFRGLGLQAQRDAVAGFLGERGHLLAEYTEVESGRRHTNRPQLQAALDECRKRRAVLLIAKLDRLARNVAFIANLMNSRDVDFLAADMPEANRLTIHILAAVAEHERELISKRTKDALAVVKGRGVKLGNPRYEESIARAREAKNIVKPAPEVQRLLCSLQSQGKGLREIAREMNCLGVRTPRGCVWYAKTVKEQIGAAHRSIVGNEKSLSR